MQQRSAAPPHGPRDQEGLAAVGDLIRGTLGVKQISVETHLFYFLSFIFGAEFEDGKQNLEEF